MYNKIKNPLTGRRVDIRSNLGKKIIKAYLSASNVQNGGISFKNRDGDFLYHIGTEEGNNALTACSACTLMALGLPDEIVNDVSLVQQANIIQGRGDGGITPLQMNKELNDLISQHINRNLTSKIYIWGKAALPNNNVVLCVLEHDSIRKREEPGPFQGTMYSIQQGMHELVFLPFSGPPNSNPDPTYFPMIESALTTIFNNLNRGSSTILGIMYNEEAVRETGTEAHFVAISNSYNGTPYVIDAQQNGMGPPYQGFWNGWQNIAAYFSTHRGISHFVTYNNSIWATDPAGNWSLNMADELDIDINAVFPNAARGNPEYLDKIRKAIHPGRIDSYLNQ